MRNASGRRAKPSTWKLSALISGMSTAGRVNPSERSDTSLMVGSFRLSRSGNSRLTSKSISKSKLPLANVRVGTRTLPTPIFAKPRSSVACAVESMPSVGVSRCGTLMPWSVASMVAPRRYGCVPSSASSSPPTRLRS